MISEKRREDHYGANRSGQRDTNYKPRGIVQLDDGYVGGPIHDGKRGRGTDKPCIVVTVSKTEHDVPLFARMRSVGNIRCTTIQETVSRYIVSDTIVECDGHNRYLGLRGIRVHLKERETNDLKWVHKAAGNLKAILLGTYHGRYTKLQAYFDESCFRYNRRLNADQLFSRLTRAVATACPLLS